MKKLFNIIIAACLVACCLVIGIMAYGQGTTMLRWTAPVKDADHGPVEKYFILRGTTPGGPYTERSSPIYDTDATYGELFDVWDMGVKYYMVCIANNSAGDSEYSNEVSETVNPLMKPGTPGMLEKIPAGDAS